MNLVQCKICEAEMKDLPSHIFHKHQIKAKQYRVRFPGAEIRSQAIRDLQSARISGDKNPAYQHGGKFSPFSEKFVGQKDPNIHKKVAETRHKNQNTATTLEYYLKKIDGNLEAAEILLKDRQATFSLEKCIQKYGEVEGLARWTKRQKKWANNFKKQNFSKISQILFHGIMEIYQSKEVYFATWDTPLMQNFANKEYRLILSNGKLVLPDFLDIHKKKIIEFDGTYWHRETQANPEREHQRDLMILEDGYQILHVKESDFKKYPEQTIQRCLNFLTQ